MFPALYEAKNMMKKIFVYSLKDLYTVCVYRSIHRSINTYIHTYIHICIYVYWQINISLSICDYFLLVCDKTMSTFNSKMIQKRSKNSRVSDVSVAQWTRVLSHHSSSSLHPEDIFMKLSLWTSNKWMMQDKCHVITDSVFIPIIQVSHSSIY